MYSTGRHRRQPSVRCHNEAPDLAPRRDHPELSEHLCVEVMRRQLDARGAEAGAGLSQQQVLTCLAPWMQNLSFAARWEGAPPPLDQPASAAAPPRILLKACK